MIFRCNKHPLPTDLRKLVRTWSWKGKVLNGEFRDVSDLTYSFFYFLKGLINHVGVCPWQRFISSRTMFLGLKRWLSSWDGLLLLQGIQGQLPSPLSVAHNCVIFSSRGCDPISWLPRAPAHKWHPLTHTCMHKQKWCLKAYYYLAWHPLVGIAEIMYRFSACAEQYHSWHCTSQLNLEMWLAWELHFKITFIWINFNLNSHGWLY